jgi:hypothetical protein
LTQGQKLKMESSLQVVEKLSAIHRNQLVAVLEETPETPEKAKKAKNPVWKVLLTMPLDIISLARATTFCIRPTVKELQICMLPWRQAFYHTRWTEPVRREVMLIGKDLDRL